MFGVLLALSACSQAPTDLSDVSSCPEGPSWTTCLATTGFGAASADDDHVVTVLWPDDLESTLCGTSPPS